MKADPLAKRLLRCLGSKRPNTQNPQDRSSSYEHSMGRQRASRCFGKSCTGMNRTLNRWKPCMPSLDMQS